MFRWGIMAICLFGLGFLGFTLVTNLAPNPNSIRQTTLTLSTNNLNPSVGQSFDIALNINTAKNVISESLISIDFDENLAKYVSLEPASGFIIDSQSLDSSGNGLEFRIKAEEDYTGSGTIARLKLNALNPGLFVVEYGNRTIVGAASELGENVLVETHPIEINIK